MYRFGKFLSIIFCRFLFRLKIHGRQNIPKEGGFILACNHLSYLDPIVLGVACPRDIDYMARHDLFENKIFGRMISSVNAFPVKRDSADLSAIKEVIKRVGSGKVVGLFPQGGRKEIDSQDKPEAGIGFLAAKTNAPVIPAFISGTQRALPKGAKFIRPGEIIVSFGNEIPIERGMPYSEIAEKIMAGIRQLANECQVLKIKQNLN